MKTALLWFAVMSSLLGASPRAQAGIQKSDPEAAMAEQISLIAEALTSSELREELGKESLNSLELDLERAATLMEAGHWLAGLRPLVQVQLSMDQSAFVRSGASIQGLDDLVSASAQLLRGIRELPSPLEARLSRPAELQALLEENHARAEVYAIAAPEQGREASLRAGIFYLAQGRAHAAMAQWLLGLAASQPAHPMTVIPGLEAYFGRLERELLEVYQPPLSKTLHSSFIQISANLKFGNELRARGFQFAALHAALEVARGMNQLPTGTGERPRSTPEEVAASLLRVQAQLELLVSDTSMADHYAQLAQHLLDPGRSNPSLAQALVGRVLLDYLSCMESKDALAMPAAASTETEVTITLVRWPFT